MFHVDWVQSALDELTVIWTQADSALRPSLLQTATRMRVADIK